MSIFSFSFSYPVNIYSHFGQHIYIIYIWLLQFSNLMVYKITANKWQDVSKSLLIFSNTNLTLNNEINLKSHVF